MLELLFPITSNWSWSTFFLYLTVSFVVCGLCKKAAKTSNNHNVIKLRKWTIQINTLCYFAAFLVLVFLGTLRSAEVGADTKVYVGYFENAQLGNFDWSSLMTFHQMEPGFQLYLIMIRQITEDYHILFLITYSIVAASYIRYIKYFYDAKSDYIFLQLFIFFYVSNMSGMRAALGTVFLLLSFIQLSKKKYLKTFILTIVAATFHYTMIYNAIIIFITWLLERRKLWSKKWIFLLGILFSLALTYFSTGFMKSILSTTKYDFYSSVSLDDISILGSSIYAFYAIGCFIFYRKIYYFSNRKLSNIFLTTLGFLITYPAIYVTAAYRIPNYYAMPRLTIWSEFMKYSTGRVAPNSRLFFRMIVQLLIILYLLFRFTRMAQDGNFTYIPFWAE